MTKAARPVLQFRVHPDIYAALKKASGENGTSISEEAASRLERSIFPKGRRSVFSGKLAENVRTRRTLLCALGIYDDFLTHKYGLTNQLDDRRHLMEWEFDPSAVSQLSKSELMQTGNFGKASLRHIEDWLSQFGLELRS
jgi:hypothetical protein